MWRKPFRRLRFRRVETQAARSAVLLFLLIAAVPMLAESHFVPYAGGRVHYESYGSGSEAVVFIHGWTCDLTFWRAQAPVYEHRRTLLIDLPGHGESDKPKVSYPVEFFARGVEAAMQDAGVERAVIVGHSLGGPIAYAFLRLFREQVKGIVLVDTGIAVPQSTAAYRKAQEVRYAANRKALSGAAGAKYFLTRIEGMFTDHTPADLRDQIRSRMLATPEWVRVAAMSSPSQLLPPPPGESFDFPVLSIQPTPAGPDNRTTALRKLFPRVSAENWDGAGHFLMMEDPGRFNRSLEAFLTGLAQK
jgi:pimeloyl-ACP methyl ester carboxylesterase